MEHPRKIDRSFKERLGILHLLERLKKENITYAEMDEIGHLIGKAGNTAVRPLVRRLWREKSGSLISKYTYLLEFLDDNNWLDQVIQIALKRRDLEQEGQAALLGTLHDCGIDVTLPPFSRMLSGNSGIFSESFPKLMDKGEEGLLWFLEEFDALPPDLKRSCLDKLSMLPDSRLPSVLKHLLWHEDLSIAAYVVETIGKIRSPEAVAILDEFRTDAPLSLQKQVERSLRRLSFAGVSEKSQYRMPRRLPFHSAYASPVDGAGYRNLWIARWLDRGGLAVINMQLHDVTGIIGVWGNSAESEEKYEEDSAARSQEELVEQVSPGFALKVIADALFQGGITGRLPPPGFYLWRSIFAPHEITSAPYEPVCSKWQIKVTPPLLSASAELFEDEFFSGWYLANCHVYEMAEEWMQLEKNCDEKQLILNLEQLLERFCREELKPQLEHISRRLFLNADYLAHIGMDGQVVKVTLAAAESIRTFPLPCHMHPFLRRLAMESLVAAREAMEEGYDLRDNPDDEDWE